MPVVMELPLVDLAQITDDTSRLAIARKLAIISRTTGCVVLKNHGVDVQQMMRASAALFEVPIEQQQQWAVSNDKDLLGYEPDGPPGSLGFRHSGKAFSTDRKHLPPLWQAQLHQIDVFKQSCQALVHRLLVYLSIAMDEKEIHYRSSTYEAPGADVQLRVIRYTLQTHDPSVAYLMPSSPAGSITIGCRSTGLQELETASNEWCSAGTAADTVTVYLGDAVPLWSYGHHRRMRYRFAWSPSEAEPEAISLAYHTASGTTAEASRNRFDITPIRQD